MRELLILKEPKGRIKEAKDIFKRIKKINIDYDQENFISIYLNAKNKVLGSEVLFKGGLSSCLVSPHTIFRKALLKNACKIIIAHNHPSNDLTPSQEDIEVYKVLKDLGEKLELNILDNIVFNKKEYYSLNNERGN